MHSRTLAAARPVFLACLLSALSGCLPQEPPLFMTEGEKAEAPLLRHQQGVKDLAYANTDQLLVEVRDVNVLARELRVSGRVTNLYEDTVEGVRYRLELRSTDGERKLGTEYLESGDVIEAGQTLTVRLRLESMYTQTIPRLAIEARPVLLGGQPQPVPEGWQH